MRSRLAHVVRAPMHGALIRSGLGTFGVCCSAATALQMRSVPPPSAPGAGMRSEALRESGQDA